MSNDVLIIPTFSRPEFLWLCLEQVVACSGYENLDILVTADFHEGNPPPLQDITRVLEKFSLPRLKLKVQTPHRYHGNSYNVMTAYRDACVKGYDYIFMIEDDVMVMPTFLEWHRHVHELERPAVSIGVVQTKVMHMYASLGVCFPRTELLELSKHCCHEYFSDMRGYIKKVFPPSSFEFEQDGLICRLLDGKKVVWAKESQAQHVGWYGYHRRKSLKPSGSVEERYKKIKEILADPVKLEKCVRDYGDIEPLKIPCI